MTLQEIIKTLQAIALTQPNVRTATDGDIYEVMNGNEGVRYGVFHITQNTHQSYDDRDVYGLNLFYVDRNEDDNANTLQVQSTGKNVIDNIVRSFIEEFDGEYPSITYTPFTQRFKDDTAGVFAALSMEVYKEWTCAEAFGKMVTPQVVVRNQSKTIQITESGVYEITPDDGFTGLDKVVVDAEFGDTVQDEKSIEITESGQYSVVPDEPFLSVGKVDVDVNIPIQDKKGTCILAAEGLYNLKPNDGYVAMKSLEALVALPSKEKSINITSNGEYEVTHDSKSSKMTKVNISVNTEERTRMLNGVCFSGSTFETLEWGKYVWDMIYDGDHMFDSCPNFNDIHGALNNIPIISGAYMFANCPSITEVKDIDFTKYDNVTAMFRGCNNIEYVDNVIFPYMPYSYYNSEVDNALDIGVKDFTVFGPNCDWSNTGYISNGYEFAKGRYAHIKKLDDRQVMLLTNITQQVLDCDKPASVTTCGSDCFLYKEGVGWEEFFANKKHSSGPMGLHIYLNTDDPHTITYVDDKFKIHNEFEHLGNGHYYRDAVSYIKDGELLIDGISYGFKGNWLDKTYSPTTCLRDKTYYVPIQPEQKEYEGEDIFKLCYWTNEGWEYSLDKNGIVSTNHDHRSTQDIWIVKGDFNSIDITFGQSSESGYDFLQILTDTDTLISSGNYMQGDDLQLTVEIPETKYLKFRYKKDTSGSNGEDRVWIKKIRYYNI